MSMRYKLDLSRSKISDHSYVVNTDRHKKAGVSSNSSRNQIKIDEKFDHISPFLQKKLDALSITRNKPQVSNYCKINCNGLGIILLLSKLYSQRLLFAIRSFEQHHSPIAFTQCPRCDHVGLSLLTKSTKQQLSPRFHQKILSILPSKPISSYNRKETPKEKNYDTNKVPFGINKQNTSDKYIGYQDYKETSFNNSSILKENRIEIAPKLDINNIKRARLKINCKKVVVMLQNYVD